MPLNIKDPETDRLARELAREAGESITVAARTAFEERLSRLRRRHRAQEGADELWAVIARGRARARETTDSRSEAEILGYEDDGLPG